MAERLQRLSFFSGWLARVRLPPGQPAFAHPCTDECAPGEKVTGEPPGAHPNGNERRDQAAFETAFPQCLGPRIGQLWVFRMAMQEQHAQGVEMAQEALPV